MTLAPLVLITSTTEIVGGASRIMVKEAYAAALAAAGLLPVALPPIDVRLATESLGQSAGLLITGGEDIDPIHFGQSPHPATGAPHAARDSYELALVRAAATQRIPTLAICRGAQIVNVAFGGSLVQDIPSERPSRIQHAPLDKRAERVHEVTIEPTSRLADIVGATSIQTNSSHHQSVDRLGAGLRITARSDDGIVEAIESTDPLWWMVAVQWHPEELIATTDAWDRRLFAEFARAVAHL